MAIDVHNHLVPPGYRRTLRILAERGERVAFPLRGVLAGGSDAPITRVDLRLAEMDSAGIDVAVLSAPAPPDGACESAEHLASIIADANDELLELCDAYAGRLLVLASLPLPHVDLSLAEIDRLADHPLVRGVATFTEPLAWRLDEPALEPVYQKLGELRLPLYIHPSLEDFGDPFSDYNLAVGLSVPITSTLATLRLIFSGMLDRVPTLDVVVAHLGGVLPFLTQRLHEVCAGGNAAHDLWHYVTQRLYYDSCSYQPAGLRFVVETVGAGRVLLGSDYPFRGHLKRAVEDVRTSHLSDSEQDAVLAGTALQWFGPDKSRPPIG